MNSVDLHSHIQKLALVALRHPDPDVVENVRRVYLETMAQFGACDAQEKELLRLVERGKLLFDAMSGAEYETYARAHPDDPYVKANPPDGPPVRKIPPQPAKRSTT